MLLDYNDFLIAIKKAAIEAVEAGKPVSLAFGKVVAVNPLKINIEQKMALGKEQLILCKHLTERNIDMTINGDRETVTVHEQLKNGEEVILMRMQGGQKYLVLDRVVKI